MKPAQSFVPLESMEVGHYYKYFNNANGVIEVFDSLNENGKVIGRLKTGDIFLLIEVNAKKRTTKPSDCTICNYKVLVTDCVGYMQPIIFACFEEAIVHWVEEV